MSRYFKFVWAGIFLCPAPIYWVMLGLVIIIFAIGLITNRMVDDPYGEAEQQYKITVGYIIEILQIIEKAKVLHLALFDADYMNCTDRCRYADNGTMR